MPGVYKQKDCPQCGVTHRKRGPYCSQSCANKDRIVSDKVRDNMRKVVEEYRKTPEGIAAGKLINSDIAPEDYAVDIPDFPDLPDGYDVADRW
jgi:hypothetical protein